MNRSISEREIENEVYCGYIPANKKERTYGFIDALLILSGYCIATWSYTQGAYLTGLVGFRQLLITAFAGAFLMLMIYQLPVILSARFGIDIWVWLKSTLGTRGVKVLAVTIILINFPWYAVCCDLFASSMINLGELFGIHAPPVTHKLLQLFCVLLGSFMAWRGVRAITITTRILVPALVAVGGLVMVIGFRSADPSEIINYKPVLSGMTGSTAYTLALEANFAFVITLVGGMAGIPRLCKSERSAYYAGVLGQGLAGSFFVVVGAVMAIAMRLKTGVESTDPTEMLSTLASPALALFSLLLVAFANIGTQSVGSYLYGVMLKTTFPKAKYNTLVGILALYVSALCIWGKIVEYFGTFLTISAYIYAPFAALLFVDFFWVRKQKLDFRSAFSNEKNNIYFYTKGFNIVSLVCLVLGCIISLSIYNPITMEIYSPLLFKLTPTGLGFLSTALLYFLASLIPPVRRYINLDARFHPDTKPFDRRREPPRQNIFLFPLMLLACRILTHSGKLKINRGDSRGIKPPYLVLGTHQSFTDFYVTPLALFPHRANYISELEGFENFGEWIYRQAGCLGTRKFVNDISLIKNIKCVLDRGDILVLYPEARYANVGTNSELQMSVAKMVKRFGYPVVTLNMKGNYLQSPIWNLTKRKEARLTADMTYALTADEVRNLSIEEIHGRLSGLLEFDEYRYQRENKISITYPKRAEGLEMPLYQCRNCKREFSMKTKNAEIFCTSCGKRWKMDEYGTLESNGEKIYIPDWYEWERLQVIDEIKSGKYSLDIPVKIQALPNAKNFIDCGTGKLVHDSKEFTLSFTHYDDNRHVDFKFTNKSMPSIHTEYNYRGKGQCIVLSTVDNTYFVFPENSADGFNATKIQFAVEYLYSK